MVVGSTSRHEPKWAGIAMVQEGDSSTDRRRLRCCCSLNVGEGDLEMKGWFRSKNGREMRRAAREEMLEIASERDGVQRERGRRSRIMIPYDGA